MKPCPTSETLKQNGLIEVRPGIWQKPNLKRLNPDIGIIAYRSENAASAKERGKKRGRSRIDASAVNELYQKKSKYRNTKVVIDGITFDSKKEGERYRILKMLEKAGEISALSLQTKYPFEYNGFKIASYIADFTYMKDRKYVVEDVKSAHTRKLPVYRLKKKLLKAFYGIEINEV